MKKLTQKTTSKENNNCTVLALKSVTGWSYQKCYSILAKHGREKDSGFNVSRFLTFSGEYQNVNWDMVYAKYDPYWLSVIIREICEQNDIEINTPKYYINFYKILETAEKDLESLGFSKHDDKSVTLKQFAKENPDGVYYVTVKGHALAIINGVIVDNLTGKSAGFNRHITKAWKFEGDINPNLGVQTQLDILAAERHCKLLENEIVTYEGGQYKTIEYNKVLLQPGQIVIANKQIKNNVIIELYHPILDEAFTITLDRSYIKTFTNREVVDEDDAVSFPSTLEVDKWLGI